MFLGIAHPTGSDRTVKVAVASETRLLTLDLHLQGLSLEEIAHKRSLKPSTIFDHLVELN